MSKFQRKYRWRDRAKWLKRIEGAPEDWKPDWHEIGHYLEISSASGVWTVFGVLWYYHIELEHPLSDILAGG